MQTLPEEMLVLISEKMAMRDLLALGMVNKSMFIFTTNYFNRWKRNLTIRPNCKIRSNFYRISRISIKEYKSKVIKFDVKKQYKY